MERANTRPAELLLVVVGIWLAISPLPDLGATIIAYFAHASGLLSGNLNDFNYILVLMPAGFALAKIMCGLGLIASRKVIASKLQLDVEIAADTSQLLSACLVVLGLYFALNGLVFLIEHYVRAIDTRGSYEGDDLMFWKGLVSVGLGLSVALLSTNVSRIWWHLRYAGS